MDLRACPTDRLAVVRTVGLIDDDRLRLRNLGVREGAVVEVVNRSPFGACVLALGADRVALDAATCARIEVEVGS
ncbi:FeoA family protein [Xylanimonas ulmi]|uniref:Ferrous iron transport protein A n=1 Tax=Xylanimonas ulmi TaxID=228973 RepID=A0A4Q7LY75_9MICO|nr:ferrous iron transport protein A [Xylanibacterium ulmi]RZS60126.1 ferrous iron transport protein A [Xylanibacterium ulmi]